MAATLTLAQEKLAFKTIEIPGNGWCFYAAILAGLKTPNGPKDSLKLAKEISEWLASNKDFELPDMKNTVQQRFDMTLKNTDIPVYGTKHSMALNLSLDEYIKFSKQEAKSGGPKVWAEASIAGYAVANIKNIILKIYIKSKNKTINLVALYEPKNINSDTKTIHIVQEGGNHFNLLQLVVKKGGYKSRKTMYKVSRHRNRKTRRKVSRQIHR